MENVLIIVAGGVGKRMGASMPKQFLLLNQKPIIYHTIDKFLLFDPNIKLIVVLPEEHMEVWKELCVIYNFKHPHTVKIGGETRFDSVKNGLSAVDIEIGMVAIHDSVRPLVSIEVIWRCFAAAKKEGNAIPAMDMVESLRMVDDTTSKQVDRTKFKCIQTPQVFDLRLIKDAFDQEFKAEFTDDASVLESIGEKINIVQGNKENIKITEPIDIKIAEAILNQHIKK